MLTNIRQTGMTTQNHDKKKQYIFILCDDPHSRTTGTNTKHIVGNQGNPIMQQTVCMSKTFEIS